MEHDKHYQINHCDLSNRKYRFELYDLQHKICCAQSRETWCKLTAVGYRKMVGQQNVCGLLSTCVMTTLIVDHPVWTTQYVC